MPEKRFYYSTKLNAQLKWRLLMFFLNLKEQIETETETETANRTKSCDALGVDSH